jgi:osmotically-inducible protein OsmY
MSKSIRAKAFILHTRGLTLIAAFLCVLPFASHIAAQAARPANNHAGIAATDDLNDSAMTQKVKEALTSDKDTSGASSAIHVLVTHGVVTLSGDVTSQATAEHAQQVVARVTGVRDVVNDVKYPTTTDSTPGVIPPAGSTQ